MPPLQAIDFISVRKRTHLSCAESAVLSVVVFLDIVTFCKGRGNFIILNSGALHDSMGCKSQAVYAST